MINYLKMKCCFLVLSVFLIIFSSFILKQKNKTVQFIEAYTQRTVPGVRGSKPITNTYIVVVWHNEKQYPETFFWRGEGGWMNCNIEKAKKNKQVFNEKNKMWARDYDVSRIATDKITKGDTLMLMPVPGGKFPVPKEISDTAKNTLFYKTKNSNWLKIKIEPITRKQDINMP